jgi:PPOX class probable F420-dependent enzyme
MGEKMTATLEGRPKEIIAGKNYAHLAIPREDGTVQTVIVWADIEGETVTLNSAEGRSWPTNLRKAGNATVTVMADNNPYEWVSVAGNLTEATHDGADEHIDQLAKKYLDADSYPFRQPGEQRVKFVLEPERVYYQAPM